MTSKLMDIYMNHISKTMQHVFFYLHKFNSHAAPVYLIHAQLRDLRLRRSQMVLYWRTCFFQEEPGSCEEPAKETISSNRTYYFIGC